MGAAEGRPYVASEESEDCEDCEDSVDSVDSVDSIDSVCSVYSVDSVDSVDSIESIYSVPTAYLDFPEPHFGEQNPFKINPRWEIDPPYPLL